MFESFTKVLLNLAEALALLQLPWVMPGTKTFITTHARSRSIAGIGVGTEGLRGPGGAEPPSTLDGGLEIAWGGCNLRFFGGLKVGFVVILKGVQLEIFGSLRPSNIRNIPTPVIRIYREFSGPYRHSINGYIILCKINMQFMLFIKIYDMNGIASLICFGLAHV